MLFSYTNLRFQEPVFHQYSLHYSFISVDRVKDTLIDCSSEILDLYKKKAFYDKEINVELLERYLQQIICCVYELMEFTSFNVGEALYNNIEKLKVRFPLTFDDAEPKERNLDKEREKLEGN
jgi:hypothetical protein